jgi:hypothetical protein
MREDVLKIVNRDQLVSCMNNTKWHKLLSELNLIQVDKRVKYIDSDIPSNWQAGAWMPVPGYVEFSGGPTPFRYIEWLEIKKVASKHIGMLVSDCLADRYCEIQNVIGQMNLNYEENDLSFVIYGYRRASQQGNAKDAASRRP